MLQPQHSIQHQVPTNQCQTHSRRPVRHATGTHAFDLGKSTYLVVVTLQPLLWDLISTQPKDKHVLGAKLLGDGLAIL